MISVYLTPREAASVLKLNVLTIYDYIKSGQLRAAKFGRTYRISEKDLASFIRKHQQI